MNPKRILQQKCEAFASEVLALVREAMLSQIEAAVSKPTRPVRRNLATKPVTGLALRAASTSLVRTPKLTPLKNRTLRVYSLVCKNPGLPMGSLVEMTGWNRHNLRTTLLRLMGENRVKAKIGVDGRAKYYPV